MARRSAGSGVKQWRLKPPSRPAIELPCAARSRLHNAFDAALYGLRNTVERGFNRLKQWRGVATRYDKYALTYLGGVLLGCAVIHARVGANELGDTP